MLSITPSPTTYGPTLDSFTDSYFFKGFLPIGTGYAATFAVVVCSAVWTIF